MDTLIIHSGLRQGRVAELTRSKGDRLSVGRGFGNDLVIADVHIAPQQLEFLREGDDWQLRVLDFTNPVQLNDRVVGEEPVTVRSGDRLTIGRTRLALYDAAHPVERTRKLMLSNWMERHAGSVIAPLLFLLGACLLDLCTSYFEASTELDWSEYVYGILFMGIVVVIWSGLWALAGRIIRHQAQFGLHLVASSTAYMLLVVLTLGCTYLFYNLHNPLTEELQAWLVTFVALAAALRLNLLIATHVLQPLRVAVFFSALTVAVWYGLILFGEDDEFQFSPVYSSTLKPPPFNLGAAAAPDAYFDAMEAKMRDIE